MAGSCLRRCISFMAIGWLPTSDGSRISNGNHIWMNPLSKFLLGRNVVVNRFCIGIEPLIDEITEKDMQILFCVTVHFGHQRLRRRFCLQFARLFAANQGAEKRKQFAALFEDTAKRKFDCVLFWALDRFSREGMAQTIMSLRKYRAGEVSYFSNSVSGLSRSFRKMAEI